MSQKSVYTRIADAYGTQIQYGEMTLEQFKDTMMQKSNSRRFLPAKSLDLKYGTQHERTNVIAYQRSLPLNSIEPRGSITFFIPTANIQSILKNMYTNEGGASFVLDVDGNVLMSYPENTNFPKDINISGTDKHKTIDIVIDHEKTVLYQVCSSYNGLMYVNLMPYSMLMKRMKSIEGLLILSIVAIIVVGLALSYLLAYRNSKPITEMVRLIASKSSPAKSMKPNDFEFLKGSISHLLNTNDTLQSKMQQQFVLLRNDYFGKVLRNGFTNRQELDTYLSYINEKMPNGPFLAILVYLQLNSSSLNEDALHKVSAVKLVLQSCVEKQIKNLICFYDYDIEKVVLLLNIEGEYTGEDGSVRYREVLENSIRNIDAMMKEWVDVLLTFAVGIQVEDVMQIGDSVNTALRTQQSSMAEEKIIWFSDLPLRPTAHYSIEKEAKILNLARAGCYEEIEVLLKNLFEECFIHNAPSGSILKQLVHDLKGTVFQIAAGDLPSDSPVTEKVYGLIDDLDPSLHYDRIWKELLHVYKVICNYFTEQKRSRNVQMGAQLQEYILQHYRDTQLSLIGIACHFNITEVYLSQFFKEQNGQNFSDYLASVRITAACKSLENHDLSIQDIAQMSGYNSAHTFSRAFKRIMGVSPTTYRETKCGNA